jgi:NitT/TauT family transport system permease protein
VAVGGCLSLFIIITKTGEIVRPLIISIKAVPKLVFIPIILFALGQGFFPRCVIVALVCFFPIIVSFTNGLLDIDGNVIDWCKTQNMSEMEILRKMRFRFALPVIFSGLKSAFMFSVNGALLSEFFLSDRGLGHIIWVGDSYFDSSAVYSGAITLSIISIVLYEGIIFLERRLGSWNTNGNEIYI